MSSNVRKEMQQLYTCSYRFGNIWWICTQKQKCTSGSCLASAQALQGGLQYACTLFLFSGSHVDCQAHHQHLLCQQNTTCLPGCGSSTPPLKPGHEVGALYEAPVELQACCLQPRQSSFLTTVNHLPHLILMT